MLLTNKCTQNVRRFQKVASLLNKYNKACWPTTAAGLKPTTTWSEGGERMYCSRNRYPSSVFNTTATRAAVAATGGAHWTSYIKTQPYSTVTKSFSTVTKSVKKQKMVAKLTEQERSEKLQPLLEAGWTLVEGRDAIYKEYLLKDFNQAFSFMTGVALLAEKMNHHPEWFNVYNKLQVTLSTHDVGGLSSQDIRMATYMEAQAKLLK